MSTAIRTRRRTVDDTRRRIVEAAQSLFIEQGYRAVSLRDIAAAADISHPGLLRHFPSKDAVLTAVIAGSDLDNEHFAAQLLASADPGTLLFSPLAHRNAATPGYLPLFAALTGEASIATHPAHTYMRGRYRDLDSISTQNITDAIDHGSVASDRDPSGESVRGMAAWDGLQVLAQYLPDRVDVAAALESHEALLAYPLGWRDADDPAPSRHPGPIPPLVLATDDEPDEGYAVGREKRERIVADAMKLFAREGYGDTSLRDVAAKVGIAKSTLMHHYPTKDDLLRAVLVARDRGIRIHTAGTAADRAVDVLRGIPLGATDNATDARGLISVYAVLSCEAVPESHPAHVYFRERFTRVIDHFADLFRTAQHDGDLPSHRAPEHEAVWLTALWDGLQYRWLYDPDAIDIAAHLRAHLDDVLPR